MLPDHQIRSLRDSSYAFLQTVESEIHESSRRLMKSVGSLQKALSVIKKIGGSVCIVASGLVIGSMMLPDVKPTAEIFAITGIFTTGTLQVCILLLIDNKLDKVQNILEDFRYCYSSYMETLVNPLNSHIVECYSGGEIFQESLGSYHEAMAFNVSKNNGLILRNISEEQSESKLRFNSDNCIAKTCILQFMIKLAGFSCILLILIVATIFKCSALPILGFYHLSSLMPRKVRMFLDISRFATISLEYEHFRAIQDHLELVITRIDYAMELKRKRRRRA